MEPISVAPTPELVPVTAIEHTSAQKKEQTKLPALKVKKPGVKRGQKSFQRPYRDQFDLLERPWLSRSELMDCSTSRILLPT
jgi:hypothetical protein